MDFCWGGEGEAVFLESRQDSQQGASTPVSSPAILCSNELCISVHGSYATPRIANGKTDTLKNFLFPLLPFSNRLLLITINIAVWYWNLTR